MKQLNRLMSKLVLIFGLALAACTTGGLGTSKDSPFAPSVDSKKDAVDQILVGHRLMDAGEYELALDAYTRAAAKEGLTAEILSNIGSANLRLGRLGQAESNLRDAIEKNEFSPEILNNLGVILIERDKTAEAVQYLRRAFALDNGESDAIRDNLRLALAKFENPDYDASQLEQEFKLVRRGGADYLLQSTP
ncbi:type IV pilus biogenesis/stability protein PilW [Cognatishimia activa]|uniref:Type IV pilus biogenesis/stability protein PilW n=2 Tax=Cognatishimia activa TaxID=1715691 RepID=A0A0N7MBU7_9RHOB|nr:type IV pilus biogenesis/stability protein PilW [Cognatishimia activa]CUK26400.1 type IV pilus biogenesis/stability protein PilW [Cognatishimia activa]